MLSRIFLISMLTIFSSCALLRSQNLQDKNLEDLIGSIQGVGEGKGRLGIKQQQYLFSFDAIFKDNTDWILAANIPLHGEELLILTNLKQETVHRAHEASLEKRIEAGVREYLRAEKKSPKMAKAFIAEFRKMMRLIMHKELGEKVNCQNKSCQMGDSVYLVEASTQKLSLKKILSPDLEFEYVAQNLTDSIFRRGSIFLHSKKSSGTTETLLSLELFWN